MVSKEDIKMVERFNIIFTFSVIFAECGKDFWRSSQIFSERFPGLETQMLVERIN
jgi:hypothetical protein